MEVTMRQSSLQGRAFVFFGAALVAQAALLGACGGRPAAAIKAADAAPLGPIAPIPSASSARDHGGPARAEATRVLQPTAALVAGPAARAAVDALAKAEQVADRHVGVDGHESEEFRLFTAVVQAATEAELLALLDHESAVVRAYAAQHAARTASDASRERIRASVLADTTPVMTHQGCFHMPMTVARVAAQALCDNRSTGGTALLEELASEKSALGDGARRCLAGR